MGLDTSHDAFHGAYSAFNRFRQVVCRAAGGSFPPHRDQALLEKLGLKPDPEPHRWERPAGAMEDDVAYETHWYVPDEVTRESHPGLYAFLEHSDCDGQIEPAMCSKVADDLERLVPAVEAIAAREDAFGHINRDGGYVAVQKRFIAGCRAAAAANEPLDFH